MKRIKELAIVRWLLAHKRELGIVIVFVTLGLLVWYVYNHPEIIKSVAQTSPWVLLALFILYCGMIGVNVCITYATVKLCRKELPLKNNVFLSAYSSIVNFFGPLQSGPGVRAVYLKTKIGLKIRDYTFAMLFYYFAFGAINASLLFLTTAPFFTVLGLIAGIVLIIFGTRRFKFTDRSRYIFFIYFVALAQIFMTSLIYFIELHATGTPASFAQSIVYSSSANLSLFVSLTPGGIGVREAFLLFTQSLHGISPSSIVAAGILDRAFYITFLILLFLGTSIFHVTESIVPKKRA